MTFELPRHIPSNFQDIIGNGDDIVNNDFNYYKFAQAFNQGVPKIANVKPYLEFIPDSAQGTGTAGLFGKQVVRSCPAKHKPVFTFEEAAAQRKESFQEGETLENIVNRSNIRKVSFDVAPKNTEDIKAPILKLQITGNPNYDLDECDILNVVSSYGAIINIELTGPRGALIEFDDIANARNAQKDLNGRHIKDLDIKLYLSWSESAKTGVKPQEEKRNYSGAKSLGDIDEIFHPAATTQSLCNLDSVVPVFHYNSNKLTCKYEAQIENDQDFKIARKIIGPKGCNMKKILEICQQQARRLNITFQNDSLKLRLRGRGSGFKEGPEQKEADDVLHLCVSSKHNEIYLLACKLVEDLLSGLYREYGVYCQRMGRPLEAPIQIKRLESPEEGRSTRKNSMDELITKDVPKVETNAENSTSGSGSPNNSISNTSEPPQKNSPSSQWRSAIKRS